MPCFVALYTPSSSARILVMETVTHQEESKVSNIHVRTCLPHIEKCNCYNTGKTVDPAKIGTRNDQILFVVQRAL